MEKQVGALLHNRYKITKKLGEGGMARVYEVRDVANSRRYAVKEIEERFSDSADRERALSQFHGEIALLVKLAHPNIPKVVDYFSEPMSHFMVMEFIEGSDLDRLLRNRGAAFPEKTVIRWGIQLCRVLHYLHIQKPPVIFRDIKPSNVILTSDGRMVLVDFGIARIFKAYKSSDTYAMGTEGYAAPEQYLGGGQTDPRSDIYALAATLYHLATNEAPFFELPRLKDLSPQLSAILKKATELDPDHRFRSAKAMKDSLQMILGETEVDGTLTRHALTGAAYRAASDKTSCISQAPQGPTKRCNGCRSVIRARSRFCPRCGARC